MNIEVKEYSLSIKYEDTPTIYDPPEVYESYYNSLNEAALQNLNLLQSIYNCIIIKKIYKEVDHTENGLGIYQYLDEAEVYLPQFPSIIFCATRLSSHFNAELFSKDLEGGRVYINCDYYKVVIHGSYSSTRFYKIAKILDIEGNSHYLSVTSSGGYRYSYGFINVYDLATNIYKGLSVCGSDMNAIYLNSVPSFGSSSGDGPYVLTNSLFTIPKNETIFSNAYVIGYFSYVKSLSSITYHFSEQFKTNTIYKLTDKNNKSTYVFIIRFIPATDHSETNNSVLALQLAIEDEETTSSSTT